MSGGPRAIIKGDVLDELQRRAGPNVALGNIARRDLERYYGVLRFAATFGPGADPQELAQRLGPRVAELAHLDELERRQVDRS